MKIKLECIINWRSAILRKKKVILNLMAAHLWKIGTGPCLPLYSIPSYFNNRLWMWKGNHLGTSCWTFCRGMLQSWVFCHILRSMKHQMFSVGERSGLQAGQFSTWALLLRSHSVITDAASIGTRTPPYHQRCRLLNWLLITSLMVPLLFSLEDAVCIFSIKEFKNLICLTAEQFFCFA